MCFHKYGKFYPMNATAQARDWARSLEQAEQARSGAGLLAARRVVARRVGTTPAAIEHVVRGRAKRICAALFAALRAAIIDELSREIARAEHDLEMARRCGVDPRSPEMAALVAGAEAARALIRPPLG